MKPIGLEEASVPFIHQAAAVGFREKAEAIAPATGLTKLGDVNYRKNSSASAVRLFLSVCNAWSLPVKDRLVLAGGVSKPTYDNWRRGKGGTLSRDQFERVSLLLGIHKALRLIFLKDEEADRWLNSANSDDPFGSLSPLEFIKLGGIPQLYSLRSYLDAWRGVK